MLMCSEHLILLVSSVYCARAINIFDQFVIFGSALLYLKILCQTYILLIFSVETFCQFSINLDVG
uniref:Uncharacterized protein n=1 Tax=Aegilops tauschii subsp. strangulata TaxID=200361 RepID=A0A453P2V8_AEGTS